MSPTEHEVFPELRDNSAWKVGDPTWMKAREAQWRALFPLVESLRFSAADTRTLRDYFLTGHASTVAWEGMPRPSVFLLFRLWWHPDQSEKNWTKQIHYTAWGDYHTSIEYLRRLCGCYEPGLGGREHALFDVFFGGPSERTFLNVYWSGDREWITRSIADVFRRPEDMLLSLASVFDFVDSNLWCASRCTIRRALALWKEVSWAGALPPAKGSRNLIQLFEYILTGSYRAKLKKPTEQQLREREELAAELRALFDEGIGPPEFQAFWQEQKALILARAAAGGGGGKSAKAKPASGATKKKAASKPVSETSAKGKAKTAPAKKAATKKAPAKKKATRK